MQRSCFICHPLMNMEVTIRHGELKDVPALVTLGRRTFFEKWKETTSPENLSSYLDRAYSPDAVRQEIMSGHIFYLVAEAQHELVAFARLTDDFPDVEEREPGITFYCKKPLEVSRIYVAPEMLGKSIGSLLMERIYQMAHELQCDLIWLGVWEHNEAVRFYQRHGYVKVGTHKFVLGEQVDTDWVMIRRV